MKQIIFLILFLLFVYPIAGQPSQKIIPVKESAKQLFDLRQHDLAYNGRKYRLYIARPVDRGDASRPVLYMLDGNGQFPMLVNGVEEVSENTPLIVGIGYPSDMAYPKERTEDYTIPVEGDEEGGGAEEFYRFIVDKVKPFIEANYSIDTTRQALCGHSHGGLFTLYVMLNHTRSFQHYIAASPSTWWGEGAIVPNRRPFFSDIPQSVTITLGEFEEKPGLDPSRKNLPPDILRKKMQRKGGVPPRELALMIAKEVPGCRFILFEGKNHGSSIPEFLKEAIQVASGEAGSVHI